VVTAAPGARPAALTLDDDADLVAAVRRGDDHAFERLYSLYHRRISAYVRGMVKDYARAEDVTQEVFISALRRLRASEQDIALRPWLYEIARNACIDQYRRTQRAPEVLLDAEAPDSEPLISFGPTPDVAVDTKQSLDHLRHAFSGLSDVQHEILVMRELEGRSYREIGERLNLTRPAVESALFRARRRLLEEYEELSSGTRCVRVQSAINSACTGSAGVRERWRIASHVSHCNVCRRHAHLSGLGPQLTSGSLPARVAAVLPLPAFLRRALATRATPRVAGVHPDHVSGLMNMAGAVSSAAEPLSGWITAGAAAATVALAIGSASVIGSPSPAHRTSASSRAAASAAGARAASHTAASRAARTRPPSFALRPGAANGAPRAHSSTPGAFKLHAAAPAASRGAHPATQQPSGLGILPGQSADPTADPTAPISATPLQPYVHGAVSGATQAAGGVGAGGGAGGGTTAATTQAVPTDVANTPGAATQTATGAVQGVIGGSPSQLPAPPKH
jgi:RNA polymerase sigma factor (sigma-70 family)